MASVSRARCAAWFVALTLLLCFGVTPLARATNISLAGSWSYQYVGGSSVTLALDRITSNATSGTSGTLRLELWAFASPYTGGTQTGYQLATYQLSTLKAGASLTGINSGALSASFPPTGAWHMTLLVSEFNGSSWTTVNYAATRLTNTLVCSAGSCSVVVAPAAATLTANQSSYTLDTGEELVLSGSVLAGTAAGSKVDIYVQALVDNGAPYYLNAARVWGASPAAMISGFTLADVTAPNFYRLKLGGLPTGSYTFRVLVAKAGNGPVNPLATGSVQSSFTRLTLDSFKGVWKGTYAGSASGVVSFTVEGGNISVTAPAQGEGILSLGSSDTNWSFFTVAPTGSCTWSGPFLAGGARQSSASGLWSCSDGKSGVWNAARADVAPPVAAGAFDGVYDFAFTHPVPGGNNEVRLARFITITNGVVTSTDGTVRGNVINAAGGIQFTGPCWADAGGVANFNGNLLDLVPRSGAGNYNCQNGVAGGNWTMSNGR